MGKLKNRRTADCVVAGYRPHIRDPRQLGSLLLGLYDDGQAPPEWASAFGGLMPVGGVGSFTSARRRELLVELEPLAVDLADHPWGGVASEDASRWRPDKSLSFVPLRPELVVEVLYDHADGGRFRHPAQFLRWRPDREPVSCGFDQLEAPLRGELAEVLGDEL